jgi:hypothetical protein
MPPRRCSRPSPLPARPKPSSKGARVAPERTPTGRIRTGAHSCATPAGGPVLQPRSSSVSRPSLARARSRHTPAAPRRTSQQPAADGPSADPALPRAAPTRRASTTRQRDPKPRRAPNAGGVRGSSYQKNRRRPTLPGPCGPSTIGAERLNCSVRNGKRCFPLAKATGNRSKPRLSAGLQNCTAPLRRVSNIRQALDQLVPVSCRCCHPSRSGLSTWWSTRGLTPSRGWESSSRGRLPA